MSEAPSAEHARLTAMAEVSALVCHRKCVVEGRSYFCVENQYLVVAGVAHAHLCAVHRGMSVEAQAARLENAIRDKRRREDLRGAAWNDDLCEAARIGRAASSGVDWTRTEGAALYAAVKAGQDALRRGATSEEAVAAIHAAGAESSCPEIVWRLDRAHPLGGHRNLPHR